MDGSKLKDTGAIIVYKCEYCEETILVPNEESIYYAESRQFCKDCYNKWVIAEIDLSVTDDIHRIK